VAPHWDWGCVPPGSLGVHRHRSGGLPVGPESRGHAGHPLVTTGCACAGPSRCRSPWCSAVGDRQIPLDRSGRRDPRRPATAEAGQRAGPSRASRISAQAVVWVCSTGLDRPRRAARGAALARPWFRRIARRPLAVTAVLGGAPW
jgi:hypothetical protein